MEDSLAAPGDGEHRLLAGNAVQERTHVSEPVVPPAAPPIAFQNMMFSYIVQKGNELTSTPWGVKYPLA